MAGERMFRVVGEPIDPSKAIRAVEGPDAGAVALFLGTVRDENEGRRVVALEYDAYAEMAERVMAEIGRDIAGRLGCRLAIVHRIGRLRVGEISVVVAAAAPHRAAALEACREGIETLKRIVPIWKKEYFEGGEMWIEGRCG
jgi:molybdopterin synthase catalytic subunit